jgi:guanylate kinase
VTVLAGPSGVGKGAVSADIRRRHPHVWISVSATTRRPRPDEVDGVHYHFVDDAEFDRMIADGEFLEWATIHSQQRSGTPRRGVEEAVARGRPVLLEIDIQGARQVRRSYPDAAFVFLAPPSWDELLRRLEIRGTEDADELERRLGTARTELAAVAEFDVTIVNHRVEQAADELVHFMGRRASVDA